LLPDLTSFVKSGQVTVGLRAPTRSGWNTHDEVRNLWDSTESQCSGSFAANGEFL